MWKLTGKDGVERTVTEIVANDVILLSGREEGEPAAESRPTPVKKAWSAEEEFFGEGELDELGF